MVLTNYRHCHSLELKQFGHIKKERDFHCGGFGRVRPMHRIALDALGELLADAGDLKEAAEQKAAMSKAKVPLLTATETAVNANAGTQAVSIVPELKNGQATAEVTLLQGTTFKKVMEKLD